MYLIGDPLQPLRTMINPVHAYYNCRQDLSCTYVAGRLFPLDMLLSSLQRHPQSRLTLDIFADTNYAPRHLAAILRPGREKRRMRATIPHGHSQALTTTHRDISPIFPRWSQQA